MSLKTDTILESLSKIEPISTFTGTKQVQYLISLLLGVLDRRVSGDVVELGCCIGSMSLFIKRCLLLYGSTKNFHVYDSFLGLPPLHEKDIPDGGDSIFEKDGGRFSVQKETLVQNFDNEKMDPPIIHSGWFSEIPDPEYPDKICFAYLDGDLYTSIMDSMSKIYKKMARGG